MAPGAPGAYANPSQVPFVINFFNRAFLNAFMTQHHVPDGAQLTLAQVANLFGIPVESPTFEQVLDHFRLDTAFMSILERLPDEVRYVSLQGEGEPTAHPRLWDMAAEVMRQRRVPYTITNGSYRKVERIERACWTTSIGSSSSWDRSAS